MKEKGFLGISSQDILLIASERVGDCIFMTPAIALLKNQLPEFRVSILVFSVDAAGVYENNPNVYKVYIRYKWKINISRLIASHGVVIDIWGRGRYPDFLKRSNFFHINLAEYKDRHNSDKIIDFIGDIFQIDFTMVGRYYRLYPLKSHSIKIANLLEKMGKSPGDILIGCHLGCHRIARRGWKIWRKNRVQHKKVWPIENYIALAKKFESHKNVRFVLIGGGKELFLGKRFLKGCPSAINLIGKTSFLELVALMKFLKIHLTHDTCSFHVACCEETPLIGLFGGTLVSETGPYPSTLVNSIVIDKSPISSISVEEVYHFIADRL